MSLYNMMFGQNNKAKILLKMLNITEDDCGRYRDVFLTDEHIVIHTRNGGGNRDDFQYIMDDFEANHPLYHFDRDDEYDCTYCNIHFKHPPEFSEELKQIYQNSPDLKPSEKWTLLMASLENTKSN